MNTEEVVLDKDEFASPPILVHSLVLADNIGKMSYAEEDENDDWDENAEKKKKPFT